MIHHMFKLWGVRVLREEAGAGGGDAGGSSGAGDAGGAGEGQGDAGNAGAAGSASAVGEGGSAAAGAASAAAAGAGEGEFSWINEKYRVTGEDGKVNLAESSRRIAEAHAALEKRMGAVGVAPASPDEYTVTVPEGVKGFDGFDPKTDEGYKAFAGKMHELGLTQKQMDGVMSEYFSRSEALVLGAAVLDANATTETLKKDWAGSGGFEHNIRLAYQAGEILAKKAGLDVNEVFSANALGNSVPALKILAALAPELIEDTNVTGSAMSMGTTEDEIHNLMRSDAYKNSKHADHERVSQKVRQWFEKKHGTQAAA